MPKEFTQYIDTDSYIGGQVLIQTRAIIGEDIRINSCRAKIAKLSIINGSTFEIECDWIAVKKGNRFHFDPKADLVITVEIGWIEISRDYTMIINYREDDLRQTYKFMEPGHYNCISAEKVIGLDVLKQ